MSSLLMSPKTSSRHQFNLLTIFPHLLDSYLSASLLKRAQTKKILTINSIDLRHFTTDKHHQVDDTPYGGGPGMVMKIEPIYKTLKKIKAYPKKNSHRVILLSPRGEKFNQTVAQRLLKYKTITFICGRYEAIDERVKEKLIHETLSIGDYVISGGELAALVIIETISRLIPGVIGKMESALKEDFPQYTKPELFKPNLKTSWRVPPILLTGHHKNIAAWRHKRAK